MVTTEQAWEVDITQILHNASGGLKQKHWLKFVPTATDARGMLETVVKLQMTVLSTVVT